MENLSYLTISLEQFTDKLQTHILLGKELSSREVKTDDTFAQFKSEKENWEKEIKSIFEESFSSGNNIFLDSFLEVVTQPNFHITGINQQRPLYVLIKDAKDNLNAKINNIIDTIREIGQCEYIIEGKKLDLASRGKFTIKQKLSLLLQKLYELNDGRYYSIEMILSGNGIKSRNFNEPRELAKILEANGYIDIFGGIGSDISAKITSHGCMAVEEQAEPQKENYNDIPTNQEILNGKIDEIIEVLNNHGLGQEVLFNELQELKDQFGKMNKKNWGQLLKGKLIDLALGKIVENDTISFIYEKLTGHELHLLS